MHTQHSRVTATAYKKQSEPHNTKKTCRRIFFPHVNILTIRDGTISSYKTKQTKKRAIYSPDGIFELQDDSLWKMMPNDICIDKSNDKFMVDKSTWIKKDEWYQIPFNHICVISFKYVYKLSPKSMVECIIEKNEQGGIIDFYMETDFSINVKGVKEDILTFLYTLNF
jgi:hypothetical protein